jgi:hypothetical protein
MANSNEIQRRYYRITKNPSSDVKSTHLEAEVYYRLGGMNYFNSKVEQRGYVISVSPIERSRNCVSYVGWTGKKLCIIPAERKTKKKTEEALKYFEEHIEEFMKEHFGQYEVDLENYEVR